MARIDKTINLRINAKQPLKTLDELGGSFEKVHGEGVEPTISAIGTLEDRLYEMAAAGQQNTKEFEDLAVEIGRYRKVMIDTDLVVDAMSQSIDQNMGTALQGVSDAFELGMGTMGMFGVESEQVEGMLLKVQSAMAISQGIQGIREGIAGFKKLKNAIMASTVVQKVLNVVMSLNPIGVIVMGVTALIALVVALWKPVNNLMKAWFGVAEATESAEEMNERLNKSYEKTVRFIEQNMDRILGKQKRRIALMEAEGVTGFKLHKQKLGLMRAERKGDQLKAKAELKTIKDLRIAKQKAYEEGNQELALSIRDEIIQHKDKYHQLLELDKDHHANIKIEKINFKKQTKADNEAARQERIANAQRRKDEEKQEAADRLAAQRLIEDKLREHRAQTQLSEISAKKLAHERELKDLLLNESLNDEEKKKLKEIAEDNLERSLQEIRNKWADKRKEKEEKTKNEVIAREKLIQDLKNETLKDGLAKELELERQAFEQKILAAQGDAQQIELLEQIHKNKLAEINDTYREEQKQKDKEAEEQKQADREAAMGGIVNAMNSLSSLSSAITDAELAKAGDDEEKKERIRKKAFERDKQIQLATAIVTGIQSVMQAYNSTVGLPVVGPVLAPIMAALAAATTAANIAKIKNTKYESSSPTPADTGGGGAPSVPQFNVVGAGSENQLAQAIGGQQNQPARAYVVSGDVTTAQSLDRNKIENASL